MKQLLYAIAVTILFAGTAVAQDRVPAATATQDRTYYNIDRAAAARAAIQQRAAWKAAQRQARIEMNRWFGYSPLRPATGIYPSMGSSLPWMGPVVYYQYPGSSLPRTGLRTW